MNLNLHVRDDMQKVSGTLMTNHALGTACGRGDVKLFSNAMYHLSPTDRRHLIQDAKADEKKEKKEHREKGERTEREVRQGQGASGGHRLQGDHQLGVNHGGERHEGL